MQQKFCLKNSFWNKGPKKLSFWSYHNDEYQLFFSLSLYTEYQSVASLPASQIRENATWTFAQGQRRHRRFSCSCQGSIELCLSKGLNVGCIHVRDVCLIMLLILMHFTVHACLSAGMYICTYTTYIQADRHTDDKIFYVRTYISPYTIHTDDRQTVKIYMFMYMPASVHILHTYRRPKDKQTVRFYIFTSIHLVHTLHTDRLTTKSYTYIYTHIIHSIIQASPQATPHPLGHLAAYTSWRHQAKRHEKQNIWWIMTLLNFRSTRTYCFLFSSCCHCFRRFYKF